MKRLLTLFVALFCFWAATSTVSNLRAQVVHHTEKMYGFNTGTSMGIISFPLGDPVLSEIIYSEPEYNASAGAFAEGQYFVALCSLEGSPVGIYAYNLADGTRKLLSDMTGAPSIITDMAYDYTTSTMYCLGENYPSTSLMTLDLKTGQLSVVANINLRVLNTLACSPDGQLYTSETSGLFSKVDKTTGELTEVHDFQIYANGLQSMEFDLSTGKLYYTYNRYGTAYFNEIDMETFELNQIGSFPSSYQVVGLFPAHTLSTPSSPAAVENLSLQPADEGSVEITVSWTNPSQTNDGQTLTSIDSVSVFRNDTLVATLDDASVGSEMIYVDKPLMDGYFHYKVIAYNEDGEGMWRAAAAYVGRDVPAAPDSVSVLKHDANSVTVSWPASRKGLSGGWFDEESLEYMVVRVPGNDTVAVHLSDTLFRDENVTAYNCYYYQVYASNSDGLGGMSQSEGVFLGNEVELPFFSSLEDESSLAMWTLVDGDGSGNSWQIGKLVGSRNGAESYSDRMQYKFPLDDWMISPPMRLEQGRIYQLSLKYWTAYTEDETFEVRLGKGNTPEEQTILICDTTVRDYYGDELVLPVTVDEGGVYYFSLHHDMPASEGFVLHFEDVLFKINDEGSLKGTVKDAENVVEGASIAINGDFQMKTDAEGKFSIPVLIQGKYEIEVSALGYQLYKDSVQIEALKETEVEIVLEPVPTRKIEGYVTSTTSKPLAGAAVSLSGYDHYMTYTDAQGYYSMNDVFAAEDYSLSIVKNGYEDFSDVVDLTEDVDYGSTELEIRNLPSGRLTADAGSENMYLKWERPFDTDVFKYDNGVMDPEKSLGYDAGTEYHIMAAIYPEPSVVRYARWITRASNSPYKAKSLNLYLFDLDEDGKPTSTVLYVKKGIEPMDEHWLRVALDSAVVAPRGFMLALSGDGNVAIACDTNVDPALQIPGTNAYSTNWQYPASTVFFEENDWNFHLMLRAEAEPIEPEGASTVEVEYDVFRFEKFQADNSQDWDMLASGLSETHYEDEDFASLPQGIYQYAVRAVYKEKDLKSDFTISDSVAVKMIAKATFHLTTNDPSGSADGAVITLSSGSGRSYSAQVSGGKAVIEDIWKDFYQMQIVKEGYDTLTEEIAVNKKDDYQFEYELTLTLSPVSNIDVLDGSQASEKRVLWNTYPDIFDGFEDKDAAPDFQLNPGSTGGWSYIDADGAPTYRFGSTTFPSSGAMMAAILFNPSQTQPAHSTKPYEGDRMLAFFCPSGGVPADDWMISPELSYHKDFTFSFFARKFNDDGVVYNDELISVGYSVSNSDPESFVWLNDEPMVVPTEWTEYTYTIPSKAKYVALRRQCTDGFILFVDNVSLSIERPQPIKGKSDEDIYRVYLDGKQVAETSNTEYLLTDLKNGHYQVGITQVYETGESEMLEVAFDVEGSSVGNSFLEGRKLNVTLYGKELIVRGEYRGLRLMDITGHVLLHSESGDTSYDLSRFTSGVYLVDLVDFNGKNTVFKIVLR